MRLNYKMLAVDIDGTLVTPDKQITPKTKALLLRFQQSGGILVLASGRPPCGMRRYVEELELAKYGGYVLAFNGSQVTRADTGDVFLQRDLDLRQLPAIKQVAGRFGIAPLTYQGDVAITEDAGDPYLQLEVAINHLSLRVVNDLVAYVDFPIPKCLCTGEPTVLERLQPALEQVLTGVNVFRSEPFFLEVNPQGIGKGEILAQLTARLGLEAKDLMAVGDGYNDVTMLQYAGLGVAMANGRDVTRAAANAVTFSNTQEGLACAMERYLFKK